jgi:hypothetical protein
MPTTADYAVLCDEDLISVFAATSLIEAVEIKNQLQADFNHSTGSNEVFHMRKATRADRVRMKKEMAGFIIFAKRNLKH